MDSVVQAMLLQVLYAVFSRKSISARNRASPRISAPLNERRT